MSPLPESSPTQAVEMERLLTVRKRIPLNEADRLAFGCVQGLAWGGQAAGKLLASAVLEAG